jgi:hypothetical protein
LWPMPLFLLFSTRTMHIKLFYTQQNWYVFPKFTFLLASRGPTASFIMVSFQNYVM